MVEGEEFTVMCWHCSAAFNAFEATFCDHSEPTKICPFCLSCSCDAPDDYKKKLFANSPRKLREEIALLKAGVDLRLGELLVNAGKITNEQLEQAVAKQQQSDKRFGEIIVEMGLITEKDLRVFLLGQKKIDEIDLDKEEISPALIKKVGLSFCIKHKMIPLEFSRTNKEKIFRFAIASKDTLRLLKSKENLKDFILLPCLADPKKIESLLQEINRNEVFVLK
jgi:hypothetical protein